MWRVLVFTSLILSVLSLPKDARDVSPLDSCIGKSTKVIARAMLQGYADTEKNLVFSPLGYSSLLAMLAEGSNGETEKEFYEVLHLHRENVKQRNEFRDILTSIKEKYKINKPQLRTWFYIYKNYSVEQSYRNILSEYYLTDVKNVYPTEFEAITKIKDTEDEENEAEDMERYALPEDSGNSAYFEKQIIQQAEKEEELFKSGEIPQNGDLTLYSILNDDSNLAMEGAPTGGKLEQVEIVSANNQDSVIPENETQSNQNTKDSNEAEQQVEEKLKSKEKLNKDKTKILHDKISFGIDPVNFLPDALKKGRKAEHNKDSLMIIFNGYYFEADWGIPFDKNVSVCQFHLNDTAVVNASTIKTKGVFKTGYMSHLNSSALSLPFQGGRYSLIIILPDEFEGLNQLISDMNDTTIQEVVDSLEERELEVQIPPLNLESTTDPKPSLNAIGLTSLFSDGADLTSISKAGSLHAQEIVQLVTMKITENIGTVNYMTAMSASSRSEKEKFIANHPFIFFIEDNAFNITVVAGKVTDPTTSPL